MDARFFTRVAPAAALFAAAVAVPSTSWAGGGGHGGPVFHAGGGIHGVAGGSHGAMGGGAPRVGDARDLPPVSGVIHEHAGKRPSYSAYGHTATAVPFGVGRGGRGAFAGYDGGSGHTATALRPAGVVRAGWGGYGHVDTGLRSQGRAGLRDGRFGQGLALRGRLRFGAARRGYGYGGGYGDGAGGADGTYGGSGTYGATGVYGGSGIYGGSGTYGGGTYGTTGTEVRGGIYGGDYASEAPLAARFAEPPLAPSPGAPYSPDDRYAYAASEDLGAGPRIIVVNRHPRHGCGCGPRVQPVVYRYGVGTAY